MGAGRTETTRAIFGIDRKESGEILLDGKPITINKPMDAIKRGRGRSRRRTASGTGCVPSCPFATTSLCRIWISSAGPLTTVNMRQGQPHERRVRSRIFRSSCPTTLVDAGSLSGGNQQKVVVGKWLARQFAAW